MVTPPYYEVVYGNPNSKNAIKFYMRTPADVHAWRVENLYNEALKLSLIKNEGIGGRRQSTEIELSSPDLRSSFCTAVVNVGLALERISKQLSCPAAIVEFLAMSTAYLPDPGKDMPISIQAYAELIGVEAANYDKKDYILILTVGDMDYTIPLHDIKGKLYESLCGVMDKMGRVWRSYAVDVRGHVHRDLEIEIVAQSRHTDAMPRQEVTLWRLYQEFRRLDEMLHYKAFKGLGEMNARDKYLTCMDPATRDTYQVRGAGDVERIWALLGPNADMRKDLITA